MYIGVYYTGDSRIPALSGFTWAYNWTEGTLENDFADSRISFFLFNASDGNTPAVIAGSQFDLPIIGRSLRLSSYFGRPSDYEGFTIRVILNSSSAVATAIPFTSTQVRSRHVILHPALSLVYRPLVLSALG